MESVERDGYACACLKVTERQLREAIEESGVHSFRELMYETGAGSGCTACHKRIERYLASWSESTSASPPTSSSR